MSERLVVVANRLPVRREENTWVTSPGGLVSALTRVLKQRGGVWVGWSGIADASFEPFEHDGIDQAPVEISSEEVEEHYLGFCNATIWPLYHDAVRPPEFHRTWWRSFNKVNQRFADKVVELARPDDLIWVNDYQCQLLPAMIRHRLPEADIRFFLHIPFPPVELYARLPWRRELLEGILASDVAGFQTDRSASNFIDAALTFTDAVPASDGLLIEGRHVKVMSSPISVDAAEFEAVAGEGGTAERVRRLREELGNPERIVLGADRLDYTKGIDVRLRAFETMLDAHPELAETTKFIQIVVPSRQTIGDYEAMREEIERLAGHINGIHGSRHNMPVHYIYESLDLDALIAYYLAADVMAVTPLADGMNLVAKEFVASRVDEDGVLLLSEFAGAARELSEAVMVNPYDIDGVSRAMYRALTMEPEERGRRMRALRETVRSADLSSWTDTALRDDVPALAV
jgi:trehalose 6-phosphate synthase